MSETPAAGRIAYLIQGEEVSGAERMHAALIERDPKALVICPAGSAAEHFARGLGAEVEPLRFRPLRHSRGRLDTLRSAGAGLASARELRAILRRRPEREIVFCTSTRPGMLASLARRGLGRKLLWCAPDFLPPGPLGSIAIRLAAGADAVLCLSEAIRAELAERSPALGARARVVHPGVDPALFDPRPADPGAPVAAIVGQISKRVKRTDLAPAVARDVAGRVDGFRLRLVGRAQFREEDFELERELERLAREDPELRGVLELRGYGDVAALLEGAGILLHLRPDEPFGIVLIEAMALGLPVVAPAAAGPLEIVEDGVTGLLFPPGDTAAAAERVFRLIADPELARRLGAAGRERVERTFTLERQLRETGALLASLDR